MVGVGISAGRLQLRDLADVTVGFGELLDPATTDVELLSHQLCIQVVVDDTATDSFDIILLQLHLVRSVKGLIIPTKSFPDTTLQYDLRYPFW